MIQAIFFCFLKIYDLIKSPFVRKSTTKVIFHHPDHADLMRKVYISEKKDPPGTFYVKATPESNDQHEYINIAKTWVHNYYCLDVLENTWQGSSTWRTFSTAIVASFHLNFHAQDQTILTLYGHPTVTDTAAFQSWFTYCRQAGVQEIEIVPDLRKS